MKVLRVDSHIPETGEKRTVYVANAMQALAAAAMNAAIAEEVYGRQLTLTKVSQPFDGSYIDIEYHYADNGEPYMVLNGVVEEHETMPENDLPEEVREMINKALAETSKMELEDGAGDAIEVPSNRTLH